MILICTALGLSLADGAGGPNAESIQSAASTDQRNPNPTSSAIPVVGESSYSPKYEQACRNPKDHEEADLCQQWRSANAAENVNQWAGRQFYLIVFDSVISLIGLGITIWGVYFIKHTLDEARKATKLAADANIVARQIGEAQVRAYLAIYNVRVTARSDVKRLTVAFSVQNLGNSPVKNFNYCLLFRVIRYPHSVPPVGVLEKLYDRENSVEYPDFPINSNSNIMSQGRVDINKSGFALTENEIDYIKDGSLWLNISISTRFHDVFSNIITEVEHFGTVECLNMDEEILCQYSIFGKHSQAN